MPFKICDTPLEWKVNTEFIQLDCANFFRKMTDKLKHHVKMWADLIHYFCFKLWKIRLILNDDLFFLFTFSF